MQEYNICYSLDSTYAEQLAVSVTSILKNADSDDNFNFYILDGGLTVGDKAKIELLKNIKNFNISYVDVNNADFETCPLLKKFNEDYQDYHVSLPTYFRFKLTDYLINIDKVLYLDCDIIVRNSLKDLYNTDLSNKAAAMVLDAESEKEAQRLNIQNYFNAGVMLINLDFWRTNDMEKQLFDYAVNNQDKILWQDQDIINVVLSGKILELSKLWNYQYFQYEEINKDEIVQSNIFHLSGRFKPWLMPFEHPVYDCYYYYLGLTPWKNKITQYKIDSANKSLKNLTGGSVTNIVVTATDEDTKNIYDEITKSYLYTDKEVTTNNKLIDEKISKIYEEIDRIYEFTKEKIKESDYKNDTDLNEKISKIYEGIDRTNEFIKEKIKESDYKNETNLNEKISKIYEELGKVYDFLKEKINETKFLITKDNDNKLDFVYQEITKNYKYTEDLFDKLKTEQNVKISKIYNEIAAGGKYCEKLVEICEAKQNDNLNNAVKNLKENLNFQIDAKTMELNSILKENRDSITKQTIHKLSEVYSYINSQNSDLLNEIRTSHNELENNLNYKIDDINRLEENINSEIKEIKNQVLSKPEQKLIDETREKIEDKINTLNIEHDEAINRLEKDFEQKLNQQRIKYENKLINMENKLKSMNAILKESKQNIFSKLIKKLKR